VGSGRGKMRAGKVGDEEHRYRVSPRVRSEEEGMGSMAKRGLSGKWCWGERTEEDGWGWVGGIDWKTEREDWKKGWEEFWFDDNGGRGDVGNDRRAVSNTIPFLSLMRGP